MFSILKLLKKDHFEGQKNIGIGAEKGRRQELATLLNDIMKNANLVKLTSDASAGGGATEDDVAVDGLLTTDIILSVSQRVAGGNSLALIGWADQLAGSLDLTWTGDPGAGAIVEVLVLRVAK